MILHMNQLVAGLLDRFCADNEYPPTPEHKAFERLAVHSILGAEVPDGYTLEDTLAGDGTVGIDALAILVNGDLISDAQEVGDLASDKKFTLDVDFFFFQAKTSEAFERAQILSFAHAIQQFFDKEPLVDESEFIRDQRKVKDALYQNSSRFRNGPPRVHIYYVSTGVYPGGDANIDGAVQTATQHLQSTGLFARVDFELVGAQQLLKAYMNTVNRVEETLTFVRRVALPKVPGVDQAFIGVIPAQEYLKLITNDDGGIRRFIFYDNVRDFQNWNAVNTDIRNTLDSGTERPLFAVLNNGVTVVAKRIQAVGDEFTISDFQIVNGCQTSYVLHAKADGLGDDVQVPIRLIETTDDLVAGKITRATNSQTPIDDSELVALTDFQKELESHYSSYGDKQRLYYERRSRQYAGESVEQTRIISPLIQVRAFAAMFLDEPYSASAYYRRLYRKVPDDIFNPTHKLDPYYTAAFAWYRLDVAFRLRRLKGAFRPSRYLMLACFKYLALHGRPTPGLNSDAVVSYCTDLNKVLTQEDLALTHFRRIEEIIIEMSDPPPTRDRLKRESLNLQVIERVKAVARQNGSSL